MATRLEIPDSVIRMNILYIGDIMGEPGLSVVQRILPGLTQDLSLDFVVAQAENVTEGRGISRDDYFRLQGIGIDAFTGGNWSLYREDSFAFFNDPAEPIVRPANYPEDMAGLGHKVITTLKGKVLIVSLLGHIVGRDAAKEVNNPLKTIDEILQQYINEDLAALVVNFHGDFSSEKRIIGYYLDGKASMVVGDHWHVPTADAMILPQGTAHMTDVGMCGTLHSSLGVKFSATIPRWRDGKQTRNELELEGPLQFNALFVETNKQGKAVTAQHIQRII